MQWPPSRVSRPPTRAGGLHCCTACRDPRNLISTAKSKASSRPVFAVAPGPPREHGSAEPVGKPVLQRVKASTAETGEDDVLTDAAPAIVAFMPFGRPAPAHMPAPLHCATAHPAPVRTTSSAKTTRPWAPATTPAPVHATANPRYRPLVAPRRLLLLASLGKATLPVPALLSPCEAPMRVTAEQWRQDSLPEPAWESWESRTAPAYWLTVD